MWLLLVTTFVSTVLTDALYQYNTMTVPANSQHSQPVNTYQPQGFKTVQGYAQSNYPPYVTDGYSSQQTSSEVNPNSGYKNTLGTQGALLNNDYSQTPLNNGFSQTATSTGSNFVSPLNLLQPPKYDTNHGFYQTVVSSDSANINNDLGITHISSVSSSSLNVNLNNALSTSAANAASTSSGYSQVSSIPVNLDLISGITQSQSSSTGTENSFTETSSSGSGILSKGLPNGLPLDNIDVPLNPISTDQIVTPVIHKHIYFHVPPPEIEEPRKLVLQPQLPKKNYKIIFIKVPSQDLKSNSVRIQQEMANLQNAAIEHKTLIYVLVKKPEEPNVTVALPNKPSEHKVYFVKYNGSPFDLARQVNDEIDKTGEVVPLKPGLLNGQQK